MLNANIDKMEIIDGKIFSYVTELKNLATRIENVRSSITKNSYGLNTSDIKKKLNSIENAVTKEKELMNLMGNKLETVTVKYQNMELAVLGYVTEKTYKKVTTKNNDVDKAASKAKTKNTYKKSKLKDFTSTEKVSDKKTTQNNTSSNTTSKDNGTSSVRNSMVSYAKQFLGNPYVWGGTSLTNGADCSGFVMKIYEHFGYTLPRTSSSQASATKTISVSEAKPGDLFFYGNNGKVSHVAMYIGNGQVIHASTEKTGIKISNANYRTPIKVGRVISD